MVRSGQRLLTGELINIINKVCKSYMIYYLGYYNCDQIADEKRIAAPPGMNKMGYVISVLSEIVSGRTMVVTPCVTGLNRYVKGGVHNLNDRISLKTFDSFYSRNKFVRGLGHILTKKQLSRFLLKNIKAEDTVIVYHSLALMRIVKKIKKKKNCNLIIEVEELYSDVKEDEALRKEEVEYLQIADKYIVITELLNREVNLGNKPRIISHGTYRTVPKYNEKINDGKIHVVYAGSFNPIKGGACSAIEAAEFLDENYVLHILGKGNAIDTEMVTKKIEEVSRKTKCTIMYNGYKTGKDFDSFIQSCHIGLSTQQPDGKYNVSSFPSKILMYMSNGLPVVSVRIPAVESSAVGDCIYYYDIPDPDKIAYTIKSVEINSYINARNRVDDLNNKFVSNMLELLI